jgi:DNA-binding transcriptional LysR family regulator
MYEMSPDKLDLNLLRVFAAILAEGSVTAAGERLSLSQPAMSNALARLRKVFGDPLFVRTPRGMRPTPFAERLAQPVRQALELVRATLIKEGEFEPASSERVFRFSMTDIGEMVFLPRLLERLAKLAPHVRIEALQVPHREQRDLLESGTIDLAVGNIPVIQAGVRYRKLFSDEYVCMVRSGHPVIRRSLSRKQFMEAAHAVVSQAGTGHEIIERTLIEHGLQDRIVLRVPQFTVIAMILARTDLMVMLPPSVARVFQGMGEFRWFACPVPIPRFEVRVLWHERFHQDPANRWLRELMAELYMV